MALDEKTELREMTFIFTDGKVNPDVNCKYITTILRDGIEISRSVHRKNVHYDTVKDEIGKKQIHIQTAGMR
ncbi:MAG TPA: hypothetical protein VFO37_04850 [Chitinophagaceae bacterium]|nr:hypothetical protein [Chitinophagaceae bacterium]